MVCDAGDKYKALWVVNAYLLFQEVSVWIVQDYRKYENSPKGKDNNKKARLFNKLNVYLSFSRHTPLHERMRTTFIHPTAKRFLIGQKKNSSHDQLRSNRGRCRDVLFKPNWQTLSWPSVGFWQQRLGRQCSHLDHWPPNTAITRN